ncbi:uncharacterized protein G2W53_009495 [Senna tora]|uniref:Uncharacterized protein n=1 Tax=Senna tora TaxID=362788 RepID=A0A834WY58_9FABA|nr:uncharacterized protein G2W53_009495 [Senna tora]
MAYVQSPYTVRDFYTDKTCFTRPLTSNGLVFTRSPTTTRFSRSPKTGWFLLAHQQRQDFPAHLKRVGFHSLTNNEPK